jgi:hypothetical protein
MLCNRGSLKRVLFQSGKASTESQNMQQLGKGLGPLGGLLPCV